MEGWICCWGYSIHVSASASKHCGLHLNIAPFPNDTKERALVGHELCTTRQTALIKKHALCPSLSLSLALSLCFSLHLYTASVINSKHGLTPYRHLHFAATKTDCLVFIFRLVAIGPLEVIVFLALLLCLLYPFSNFVRLFVYKLRIFLGRL